MMQRQITPNDVRRVLEAPRLVGLNPDGTRLLMGWSDGRPLHVLIAQNDGEDQIVVLTVYEPDREQWDETLRRRR
jgi:hypothetical protein